MRLIGVLLVIAGCGNPDVPITPDGHPLPDGPPRVGGLTVTWNADPALPGEVDDKITVTEATFQIEYLQVESDLGLAERTTRSKFQLRWTSGVAPEPDTFREAPAATYQSVLIGIRPAPGQPAYEIKGNWQDDEAGSGAGAGGMMRPFRITDNMSMIMIQIACQKTLPADGSLTIPVKVNLKDAFDNLDFKNVPPVGGVLVVDGGPALAAVRSQIAKLFDLENDN
ncbi:MAG: hypothetical protein E6J90_13820 [Deltaproteobacteria bacterium]|nr:MAG: hypothetical protein E6J90_13820 [Deltaproteobacteria bacterium]